MSNLINKGWGDIRANFNDSNSALGAAIQASSSVGNIFDKIAGNFRNLQADATNAALERRRLGILEDTESRAQAQFDAEQDDNKQTAQALKLLTRPGSVDNYGQLTPAGQAALAELNLTSGKALESLVTKSDAIGDNRQGALEHSQNLAIDQQNANTSRMNANTTAGRLNFDITNKNNQTQSNEAVLYQMAINNGMSPTAAATFAKQGANSELISTYQTAENNKISQAVELTKAQQKATKEAREKAKTAQNNMFKGIKYSNTPEAPSSIGGQTLETDDIQTYTKAHKTLTKQLESLMVQPHQAGKIANTILNEGISIPDTWAYGMGDRPEFDGSVEQMLESFVNNPDAVNPIMTRTLDYLVTNNILASGAENRVNQYMNMRDSGAQTPEQYGQQQQAKQEQTRQNLLTAQNARATQQTEDLAIAQRLQKVQADINTGKTLSDADNLFYQSLRPEQIQYYTNLPTAVAAQERLTREQTITKGNSIYQQQLATVQDKLSKGVQLTPTELNFWSRVQGQQ